MGNFSVEITASTSFNCSTNCSELRSSFTWTIVSRSFSDRSFPFSSFISLSWVFNFQDFLHKPLVEILNHTKLVWEEVILFDPWLQTRQFSFWQCVQKQLISLILELNFFCYKLVLLHIYWNVSTRSWLRQLQCFR